MAAVNAVALTQTCVSLLSNVQHLETRTERSATCQMCIVSGRKTFFSQSGRLQFQPTFRLKRTSEQSSRILSRPLVVVAAVEVEGDVAVQAPELEVNEIADALAAEAPDAEATDAAAQPDGEERKRRRPVIVKNKKKITVQLKDLQPGAQLTGKVRAVQSYGCFVDVGAFTDGLVHISELKDNFVESVEAVVVVGQEVNVWVKEVNVDKGRLSLTMRDRSAESTQASSSLSDGASSSGETGQGGRPVNRSKIAGRGGRKPGGEEQKVTHNFKKGQKVKGTVRNIAGFGAFVDLGNGVEGLLHATEIREGAEKVLVENELKSGQEVECTILKVERNRISLTMKEVVDLKEINTTFAIDRAMNPFELAFRRANLIQEPEEPEVEEEASVVVAKLESTAEEVPPIPGQDVEETEPVVDEVAAEPEVVAEVPEAVVKVPEAVAEVPEAVAEVPEAVAEVPEVVAEVPEAVAEVPEAVAEVPEAVAEVPEAVAEVPEAVAEVPEAVAEVPEAVAEVPEAVAEVPDEVVEVPEVVAEVSEEVAEVPEEVAEVPAEDAPVVAELADEEPAGEADALPDVPVVENSEPAAAEAAVVEPEPAEVVAEAAAADPVPPVAVATPAAVEESPAAAAEGAAVVVSAAAVKSLREHSGAGMMDCKKALKEMGGDIEKAKEYLRKKGLASADKKSSRIAAEGLVHSYIHADRIGVLLEVNCETDFVARGDAFKDLVAELAMQVVASPTVTVVQKEDVPADLLATERKIEMGKEDLMKKPEAIREKIVDGRMAKRVAELTLLEQPYMRNDKITVQELIQTTVAAVGENIRVRRFTRFILGEGIEKKSADFAAEVAGMTAPKAEPAAPEPAASVAPEVPAVTAAEVPAATVSLALVKELRLSTGAGMMDCKKALAAANNDVAKATDYLRKKGLASADKKAGRVASEGLILSYIHGGGRIGVLMEVNCETDFVSRGEKFRELVQELAMQVAACPHVEVVSSDEIDPTRAAREREMELGREDLAGKPEAVKEKIVDGRVAKRLNEMVLLEQPYIRNDKILVKDLVKQTVAALGENIQVRRFQRYTLGEGIEKRSTDFAAEVAAVTGAV